MDNLPLSLRVILACLALSVGGRADAQQGYGSYYQQSKARFSQQAGLINPTRYLYDKYFYHQPGVSPYMSLSRRDPYGSTGYQAYVRPEQQRRSQAIAAQRPKRSVPAGPANPYYMNFNPQARSAPTAYYNQWYGGGRLR
jgi:hypothetical protein